MINLLLQNPKLVQTLRILSSANDPVAMFKQMFTNVPEAQPFLKSIEGKNKDEVIQYIGNYLKEQGIDLNSILGLINQIGLKK